MTEGEGRRDRDRDREWKKEEEVGNEEEWSDLMISTFGLFSPLKKWLLRSVLTTSLSTVNWTFLQNSLCSSGLMDNLKNTHKHRAEMEKLETCLK